MVGVLAASEVCIESRKQRFAASARTVYERQWRPFPDFREVVPRRVMRCAYRFASDPNTGVKTNPAPDGVVRGWPGALNGHRREVSGRTPPPLADSTFIEGANIELKLYRVI